MSMLKVTDLQVYYGVIQALKGISFEVNEGEVIALIGANGAGKTTILHTVTGLINQKAGKIEFEGKDISHTPSYKIVAEGMAHVPEGRRVFAELSVYDNLMMGAYTRKDKKEIAETLAMVYKRFPRLEERKKQLAGTLSGGEQQRVALARTLTQNPRIILADEPVAALDPVTAKQVMQDFVRINEEMGISILLNIHHVELALEYADRIIGIRAGKIVYDGPSANVDQSVLDAIYGDDSETEADA